MIVHFSLFRYLWSQIQNNRVSFMFLFLILICYEFGSCRLRPAGEPPSVRAAHAAAAVGTMVVFQVS